MYVRGRHDHECEVHRQVRVSELDLTGLDC